VASAEVRQIRRRIKSVESTMKITRAMELIATARIGKAQVRVAQAKPYTEKMNSVISNIASETGSLSHPLLERRDVKTVGVLVVVPAAGLTHAMSGVGEAFLDGIPMLVISGGVRNDLQQGFQLHDVDQQALMRPLTKATYKIESYDEVVSTVYRAYLKAIEGEPGPVYIELPANLQLLAGENRRAHRPELLILAAVAGAEGFTRHGNGLLRHRGVGEHPAEFRFERMFAGQSPVSESIDLYGAMARAVTHNLEHRAQVLESVLEQRDR